jgi:hypothetical protein
VAPTGFCTAAQTVCALVIETGNGTLAFLGTEDLAKNEISASYTVAGGTYDQTGTAVLVVSSPWDYLTRGTLRQVLTWSHCAALVRIAISEEACR